MPTVTGTEIQFLPLILFFRANLHTWKTQVPASFLLEQEHTEHTDDINAQQVHVSPIKYNHEGGHGKTNGMFSTAVFAFKVWTMRADLWTPTQTFLLLQFCYSNMKSNKFKNACLLFKRRQAYAVQYINESEWSFFFFHTEPNWNSAANSEEHGNGINGIFD